MTISVDKYQVLTSFISLVCTQILVGNPLELVDPFRYRKLDKIVFSHSKQVLGKAIAQSCQLLEEMIIHLSR